MPSLMDKLSDQLEYHRISAKYTAKRKPLKNTKKGSSSRSDYPVNVMYRDNATYSRDIYSDNSRSYFDEPLSKSSQVSRLGRSNTYSAPSRSPEYYNNHRNVITTRNIAGTSQRKNIGIQFDRKNAFSSTSPVSSTGSSNPISQPNSNASSQTSMSSISKTNPQDTGLFGLNERPDINQNTKDSIQRSNNFNTDLIQLDNGIAPSNNTRFSSDKHPNNSCEASNDGFLSPFDESNTVHRFSLDDRDRDYENGTGLVKGYTKNNRHQRVPFLTNSSDTTRVRSSTYSNSTTEKYSSHRFGDCSGEEDGFDDYGAPKQKFGTRSRGGSLSFLSVPLGGAAKAAINGISNIKSSNSKRNYTNVSKNHIDDDYSEYTDDYNEYSYGNKTSYSDDFSNEKDAYHSSVSEKKYSDYDDSKDDFRSQSSHNTRVGNNTSPDSCDAFSEYHKKHHQNYSGEGLKGIPPPSGIWSKVKRTPSMIRDRRSTIGPSSLDFSSLGNGVSNSISAVSTQLSNIRGNGSPDNAFHRPRFLSSASGTKSKLSSYDYEPDSLYHDNDDDWNREKYSRFSSSENSRSGEKTDSLSSPNYSLRAMTPMKTGFNASSQKTSVTNPQGSNRFPERYASYGFDDEDVAGLPAQDLSYRYKQGFGSSH